MALKAGVQLSQISVSEKDDERQQLTLDPETGQHLSSSSKPVDSSKVQGSFPPLFYVPSTPFIVGCLICGVVTLLMFTVWKDELEAGFGISRMHIFLYLLIPLISCAFTFCHIWLALWMTFYPLKYYGIGPQVPGTNFGFPLGWQGIIPFKAEKMARMAVQLMTQKLIDVKVEFSKIDCNRLASEMDSVVMEKLGGVINETFAKHQSTLWALLPQGVKEEVVLKAMEAGPTIVTNIMNDIKENILEVFDIEEFVVSFFTANKELLNQVFVRCGWDELCFIRDCGAVLGFLFGFIQMGIWIPFHPVPPDEYLHPGWISLTVFLAFGLVVGCVTNWLALKIIFSPVDPIKVGPFVLQGLFLKRQKDIAKVYGNITATEVLSAKNIIKEMLTGPNRERLIGPNGIIRKHLEKGCDDFIGGSMRSLVRAAIGETMDKMKAEAVDALMMDLATTMKSAEAYTQEALDMENTMVSKMVALKPIEFERLLHPVFEEDEWKLIVMGGVLGVFIGAIQSYFLNI